MNAETAFIAFVVIAIFGLAVAIAAYSLWAVLHNILCKKLDPILFKEPYFQKSELVNYLCWPLSSLRSMNYITLIAAPSIAKRKRFSGFDGSLPVGRKLRAMCKVQFLLMLTLVLFFFVFFGYMTVVIIAFS